MLLDEYSFKLFTTLEHVIIGTSGIARGGLRVLPKQNLHTSVLTPNPHWAPSISGLAPSSFNPTIFREYTIALYIQTNPISRNAN